MDISMRQWRIGTLLVATVGLIAQQASADVISTFDVDDEGWTIFGDAQGASVEPTYEVTGGNPGGHIIARDNVTGGTWYFAAPTKFLGNKLAAYGQVLSFDLKQSHTSSQFNADDIVLVGGGRTIVFDTAENPGVDWTSYAVTLDDVSGWKLNSRTGSDATQADIEAVLSNLTALRIRGEYIDGPDTGGLDNVSLGLVPEPASLAILGLGALMLRRRRGL